MLATRLVRLIESHADSLSLALIDKLLRSEQCRDLRKVPKDELRERTYEIYRNLSEWLLTKTEKEVERVYCALGARRAQQGVALSHFLWAVMTTKEHIWEFIQREGLVDRPVELLGELELLRLLEQFFDHATYYATRGYESASKEQRSSEWIAAQPMH